MFSERRYWFYFFCILCGFLAFFQQTEGDGSSRGAATGKTYFLYQFPTYPRDCKEVLDQCPGRNSSGVFLIKPDGYPRPFEVYCNNSFESGGWTVLMRRIDGSLTFSRNWDEYKRGFGFLSREFWLGNEKLAFMTNQQRYELRVDVISSNGSQVSVTYSYFSVSDEWGSYSLATLGNATGDSEFWMPTCPRNMIYTNCTCERTCEAPRFCQNNCEEASKCVCPDGFFLRGSDCVTPEECQCYSLIAGTVIPMGESYINSQCTQKCSCSGSGLSCSNYSCNPYARCTDTGEGGQCACNTGLIGDGRECRCPANMIYKTCTCERSCETPTVCQSNCQEASKCVCPDGFLLRGSDCVTPQECQCYMATADKVISVGESYINNGCLQQCSCSESGLSCSNYGCDPNARCTDTGEGGQCACNTGLIGDGRECRCPANMVYKTCTCERSCESPTVCQNNCQEASKCVCPEGFLLRGSDCVTPQECQCYMATANKVIPVGESYINNQCSQQCSCSRSSLSCSNYRCDSRATCSRTSEGGRCVCKTGFVGNGLDCRCNAGYLADGSRCRRPRDCDEVASVEGYSGSGLYYILPSNWQEFEVYCNMSGGRWTVFQRRTPGSGRNFKLSWNSYKRGFGDLDEDFWLGNDRIHYLTSQRNYQLRIDIIDSGNRHYRAQYNGFRIDNEGNKYRMTVLGSYSGNAGFDAMRHHLNQPFTTFDRDNDRYDGGYCCDDHNCANLHEGAWWYKYRGWTHSASCDRHRCHAANKCHVSCVYSNLNGRANGNSGQSIFWHGLSGNDCSVKYTEMKLRPL